MKGTTTIIIVFHFSLCLSSVIVLPGKCPENLVTASVEENLSPNLIGTFQVLATSNKGPVDYYGGMKIVEKLENGTLMCTETFKSFKDHSVSSIQIVFTSPDCAPLLFDTVRQECPRSPNYFKFLGFVFASVYENGKIANLGYYCRNLDGNYREEELAVWATPGFKYSAGIVEAWKTVLKKNPQLRPSYEYLQIVQHPYFNYNNRLYN